MVRASREQTFRSEARMGGVMVQRDPRVLCDRCRSPVLGLAQLTLDGKVVCSDCVYRAQLTVQAKAQGRHEH